MKDTRFPPHPTPPPPTFQLESRVPYTCRTADLLRRGILRAFLLVWFIRDLRALLYIPDGLTAAGNIACWLVAFGAFLHHKRPLHQRIHLGDVTRSMPNVSPLSCWTRPGTRGVGVGGVADFHVAVNENERVFGDKLERLQTEALLVVGRW